jgi:hypothetical protein
VIPALRSQRQEDPYFEASLDCTARLYLKKKKNLSKIKQNKRERISEQMNDE